MPFLLVRQDITKMQVDAIVNAANESLLGGGGVDGAIHRAAGPDLLRECRTLGGCKTGEAKRTLAYRLPCKYVIHTVGPVWHGGNEGEEALLAGCYKHSLQIAADSECESVAFPLISSGIYGYPKEQAIRVAEQTVRAFLQTHEMTVYLVLFDRAAVDTAKKRYAGLQQYIDDRSVREIEQRFGRGRQRLFPGTNMPEARNISAEVSDPAPRPLRSAKRRRFASPDKGVGNDDGQVCSARGAGPDDADKSPLFDSDRESDAFFSESELPASPAREYSAAASLSLDEMLSQLDESFSEMLLRKIDEKGITDAQCYKKANIDRKLFSKIRGNPEYKPSKSTALAFAIALELPLNEAREMLSKAGYAFSHSSKFDVIVEYFIMQGEYDVFEINNALFAFDQNLLGA